MPDQLFSESCQAKKKIENKPIKQTNRKIKIKLKKRLYHKERLVNEPLT